ncbi:MAG: hypothetical protein U5R49_00440 [Deltaproteobacteria bacterium]|nr:hypothetical protein [Deltaproteobacteria bacterium]
MGNLPINMFWKFFECCFMTSLCLLVFLLNVEASEKAGGLITGPEVVWPDYEGGKSHIYYSALIGSGWTDKVALPDSVGDKIMPCIVRTGDGVTWVVWVADKVDGSSLFYVHSKGGMWSEAKEIPTGIWLNNAPSIAVDKEDRPWIVWAGSDGQQESHIFFSRWNGMAWEEASRVNRGNSTVNVTPLIGTKSNGALWASWYGLDGTFYRPYCSQWTYDESEAVWRWSEEVHC